MTEQLSRTRLLLGGEGLSRLAAAHVIIFGIGGVGGYAVEALARAGVGALSLVDNDVFQPSNLNRQLHALHSTLGQYKVDAARERILQINPNCDVTTHRAFFLPETESEFDFTRYDYVLDAIDTVSGKIALVLKANAEATPIISCMGAGNKLDASAFCAADIYETSVCPLARVMRRELRSRGIKSLRVVYSNEVPVENERDSTQRRELRRQIPGSVSFVPAVAGLICAGEIVKNICAC